MFEQTELDEIVQEFLVESHENLDQLDRDLVELERNPGSPELLGAIFRTVHTIKGTSGFLAFNQLETVSHVGENLLSRLRDGELEMTFERAAALLELVDAIRVILAAIEATGTEGQHDHADLLARLGRLQHEGSGPASSPAGPTRRETSPPAERPAPRTTSGRYDAPEAPDGSFDSRNALSDTTIRVDVALLDQLMQLVGELVLTRNQIVARASALGDDRLHRTAHRLDVIAGELQEGVMKTRLQPIGNVWSKLPRVVRDLGVVCGRQVRLEMEGRETELDKTLLEAIKDPLTHLVRNAVDHGIEPPEERTGAGKDAEGVIRLRAFQQNGRVHIEIADDGRGIDLPRVAAKALERGIIDAQRLARMSPDEIAGLVFQPGFSTAEEVSNVSGRGVGMDVVKTNIERIGGTVALTSQPGEGSVVTLQIPLTLAIIPALTVRAGGERFAIPQACVVELVAVPADEVATAIEDVSGAPVHRLRGRVLPLVWLDTLLGLADPHSPTGSPDTDLSLVVVTAEGRRFGIVVDHVLDTEEVVVKPLTSQLKSLGLYAGALVTGAGAVSLILDVTAVGHRSGALATCRDLADAQPVDVEVPVAEERDAFLTVAVGPNRRVAIPLETVRRLEEFPAHALEHVDGREVVQYRDGILPLARLVDVMGVEVPPAPGGDLRVVVYSEGGRSVGFVVTAIHDITEQPPGPSTDLGGPGTLGSLVVQDQVSELLDVRRAVLAADPNFYEAPAGPLASSVA